MSEHINPIELLRPNRMITGMSAILLPYDADHRVDWQEFEEHVHRTLEVGLIPAVNMDTGYANLIDEVTRREVLDRTHRLAAGHQFVAGVFVGDRPGAEFAPDEYRRGIDQVQSAGGLPIFFQSYGLVELPDEELVRGYSELATHCDEFLFFELGTVFAPFGRIYSLEVYEQLMKIPNAKGAKHSSLSRALEWERLALRNRERPEFLVLTGNDLAVDMVMYGSDYLLGLSTFAPEAFAKRDEFWQLGDPRFYELNDLLQYLGTFSFREPTSAYKHSAAQFLKHRGFLKTDCTHPKALHRPDSDVPVLELMAADLAALLEDY